MALCPFFNNSGRTPKMFVVGSQQISMLCASKADKE